MMDKLQRIDELGGKEHLRLRTHRHAEALETDPSSTRRVESAGCRNWRRTTCLAVEALVQLESSGSIAKTVGGKYAFWGSLPTLERHA
jgi:hypothetical protein